MPEIKPTKVFTRENPCTKVDLWNAFAGTHGLESLTVVESRGEIGLNAPKYLLREGYLLRHEEKGVELYSWTPEGDEWLRKGLKRHLELHPEDAARVRYLAVLQGVRPKRRTVRKAA